ncbi:MAG: FG-GAP repeat domain-containing protein, partial [Cyclobacteriaceae bacterium]
MGRYFFIYLLPITLLWISCNPEKQSQNPLFKNQAESSGITFSNNLKFTAELNPYTFRNFFNGGGVAIGDINNDGLADIYFSGNQTGNKLYLNEGNLKFRDITIQAGVECSGVWS